MGLFDFLFVDVHDKAEAEPAKTTPGAPRHRTPVLGVVLDNGETGKSASWGTDGVDVRGIQQRFAPGASVGGTILEGARFIGSFTATVAAQSADILGLTFVTTDNALRKRLATPPPARPKPKR